MRTGRRNLSRPVAGKLSSSDPAQAYPQESPRYPALQDAVTGLWRQVRAACRVLREEWFQAAGLTDPTKDESLTPGQAHALDQAAETFLRTLAGGDRTAAGYASQETEDGLLQGAVYLAHSVGAARAVELTGSQQNAALTTAQRQRLAAESFQRLSKDGRLRFETRLGEIRSAMDAGFQAGENPLSIARRLGRDLTGYESGRLQTIIRTEMAFAAEGGMRDLYRADGIQRVEVIGDPNTDELCSSHIGQVYPVMDEDNLPPFHPQCFCSCIPAEES